LLKKASNKVIKEDLNSAWEKTDSADDTPKITNESWMNTMPKVQEVLVELGLAMPYPSKIKKVKPSVRSLGSSRVPSGLAAGPVVALGFIP